MTFETHTGAFKQSYRSPSPRTLLKKLMDASPNPHLAEERGSIFRDFYRQVLEAIGVDPEALDPDALIEPIINYWLENNYNALLLDFYPLPGRPWRHQSKAAARAAAEERAKEIEANAVKAAAATAELVLLDWLLPNGKALRDCNATECRQMGKKVGLWLTKIKDRLKPGEVVGDALAEADVRKLYGGRRAP